MYRLLIFVIFVVVHFTKVESIEPVKHEFINLIINLKRHFYSRCLLLVYSKYNYSYSDFPELVSYYKRVSNQYEQAVILGIDQFSHIINNGLCPQSSSFIGVTFVNDIFRNWFIKASKGTVNKLFGYYFSLLITQSDWIKFFQNIYIPFNMEFYIVYPKMLKGDVKSILSKVEEIVEMRNRNPNTLEQDVQDRAVLNSLQNNKRLTNTWIIKKNQKQKRSPIFLNDSKILLQQNISNGNTFLELIEIYNIEPNSKQFHNLYGIWNSVGIHSKWPKSELYARRYDLVQLPFPTTSIPDPYGSFSFFDNNKIGDIWNSVCIAMNINEIKIKPKNTLSYRLPNGNWTGVIGQVQNGEVFAASSLFIMTIERKMAIEYTHPLLETSYLLVIRREKYSDDVQLFNWSKPLSGPLWFCAFGILFFISLTLHFICKLLFICINKKNTLQQTGPIFLSITALLNQGISQSLSSTAYRIVIFITYITSGFIWNSYAANLISFLTIRPNLLPFNDLSTFLKDGTYQIGMLAGSPEIYLFSNSSSKMMQEIYNKLMNIDKDNFPATPDMAWKRICQKRYALLISKLYVKTIHTQCPNEIIPIDMSRTTLTYIQPKYSPYSGFLAYTLLKLRNGGIVSRFKATSSNSYLQYENTFTIIYLLDVFSIFLILIIGIVFSMILLLLEIFYRNIHKIIEDRLNMISFNNREKKNNKTTHDT